MLTIRKKLLSISLFIICAAIAGIAIFLAKGYNFNFQKKQIVKTGMIYATSIPDGASVFIDDKLVSATNATISNLDPGAYTVKISKNGYYDWKKELTVRAEIVNQIEALLIPSTPELKPATYDGISRIIIAPDTSKAALLLSDEDKSGIWILSFNNLPFGTGYSIKQIVKDTSDLKFSKGEIYWSNDAQSLLVSFPDQNQNYLLDPNRTNDVLSQSKDSKETILDRWQKEKEVLEIQRKKQLTESELKIYAQGQEVLWAPNNLKFLYKKDENFYVYSLEQEKVIPVIGLAPATTQSITWYPDSNHLVAVENYANKIGRIVVIEEDGGNKTIAYEGFMSSPEILLSPDGKRLFMLTSFNLSINTSSLYFLSLR